MRKFVGWPGVNKEDLADLPPEPETEFGKLWRETNDLIPIGYRLQVESQPSGVFCARIVEAFLDDALSPKQIVRFGPNPDAVLRAVKSELLGLQYGIAPPRRL